jgi:hypothetical protein
MGCEGIGEAGAHGSLKKEYGLFECQLFLDLNCQNVWIIPPFYCIVIQIPPSPSLEG